RVGLLEDKIMEEIDLLVIGSTNLKVRTYRSTMSRFSGQKIPEPNFNTPFKLITASGELVLSGMTIEEEAFIKERLAYLKGISNKKPSELLAEILSNFYTTYLKASIDTLPVDLNGVVMILKQDYRIQKELLKENKDINVTQLKEIIIAILAASKRNIDYVAIFKEMAIQATAHPQNKPTKKQLLAALDKMIMLSFILQPYLKAGLDKVNIEQALNPANLFLLREILAEIKPEAEPALREAIDAASGLNIVQGIIRKRIKTEEGKGFIELEFLPAKTKLDYFFGYFGENCTSEHPEELLNNNFTPIRIIRNGKIVGCIHTLTLNIKGEKSMVICGIEPQTPLANEVNAKKFVEGLLNKLSDIAQENGYRQLLLSTSDDTISNRMNIREAIKELIENKPLLVQEVQHTFPAESAYVVTNLRLWAKIPAVYPLADFPSGYAREGNSNLVSGNSLGGERLTFRGFHRLENGRLLPGPFRMDEDSNPLALLGIYHLRQRHSTRVGFGSVGRNMDGDEEVGETFERFNKGKRNGNGEGEERGSGKGKVKHQQSPDPRKAIVVANPLSKEERLRKRNDDHVESILNIVNAQLRNGLVMRDSLSLLRLQLPEGILADDLEELLLELDESIRKKIGEQNKDKLRDFIAAIDWELSRMTLNRPEYESV
ncbi:MAG: hypothetical protein Q7S42_01245, partial [Candidatus Omnitrophota bacterium]|nr:hypothetical protein [Candidatus Omnitrophota bacterium]